MTDSVVGGLPAARVAAADGGFFPALAETLQRQYAEFPAYRNLCAMHGMCGRDLAVAVADRELHRVPAVPADWFKPEKSAGLFAELSRPGDDGCWLTSSSTSGDPSYTWRTEADVAVVRRSFARYFATAPAQVALFFSPSPDALVGAGAHRAVDGRPARPYAIVPLRQAERGYDEVVYLARPNSESGGMSFDRATFVETLDRAEAGSTTVALCLSVLMLRPAVEALPRDYALGDRVRVLTGAGGWDGRKGSAVGEPIDKDAYIRMVGDRLGIPPGSRARLIRDGYGTTENGRAAPGRFSSQWGDFVYTVDPECRLVVVDPASGSAVGRGGRGFPRFLTPYGVSGFAGACVEQRDLVTVAQTAADGAVVSFTHVSRAGGPQDAAGCALDAAEEVLL